MTRIKIYNEKTGKLNLKTAAHVRQLISKLLEGQLFSNINIPNGQTVVALLKLVLQCIEQENNEQLQRQVAALEQQLQASGSN
jgi:cell division protein YceG involved in septum cleavage